MTQPGPPVPAPAIRPAASTDVAGFGQRIAGRILDGVVLIAPILLWAYVVKDPAAPASDRALLLYLLILGFSFLNEVALTALTGRSIGKAIAGTNIVLAQDRRLVTLGAAMIRWFVMVVLGVIPFGGIVDALSIFSGQNRQTLHDKAAGTIVVRVAP